MENCAECQFGVKCPCMYNKDSKACTTIQKSVESKKTTDRGVYWTTYTVTVMSTELSKLASEDDIKNV